MNEVVALDPEYGYRFAEMPFLLSRFGLNEGRFLARVPRHWKRALLECASQLPEIQRLRISVALERAIERGGLLPIAAPMAEPQNGAWIERALRCLEEGTLNLVISDKHPLAVPIEEAGAVLEDIRGEQVLGNCKEYLRLAGPLLALSDEVFMVDPYFTFSSPSKSSVLEAIAANLRRTAERLVVITRNESLAKGRVPAKIAATRLLAPFLSKGKQAVILGVEDECGPQMHARYLLSIKGAIRFDKGFDLFPTTPVDIEAVSPSIHKQLIRLYIEDERRLDVRDRIALPENA